MLLWIGRCQEERGSVPIDLSGTSGRGGSVGREAKENVGKHMWHLTSLRVMSVDCKQAVDTVEANCFEPQQALLLRSLLLLCTPRGQVRSVLVRSPLTTGVYFEL